MRVSMSTIQIQDSVRGSETVLLQICPIAFVDTHKG